MRFLVDVCAGRSVVEWLKKKGYDTTFVRDRDPSMADEAILEWAYAEERVLITLDKDFGNLSVKKKLPHCGMIRLPNVPSCEKQGMLKHILERHSPQLKAGAIITVRGDRIRIRHKTVD